MRITDEEILNILGDYVEPIVEAEIVKVEKKVKKVKRVAKKAKAKSDLNEVRIERLERRLDNHIDNAHPVRFTTCQCSETAVLADVLGALTCFVVCMACMFIAAVIIEQVFNSIY